MLGIDGAVATVAATLSANLAAKVTELEGRYGLPAGGIGAPSTIQPYPEPPTTIAVNDMPAVRVDGVETVGLMPLDEPAGNLSYLGRYRLRVYVWVRDQEYGAVALKQRRYALAVREVLLNNMGLGTTGARVDDNTVRESYSDVSDAGQARFLAAAFVEAQVTLEEMLTTPPVGQADQIAPELSVLTIHPALGG